MAILVSNPSTVQFSGSATEPQDPAGAALDSGFTEELANAMQPSSQPSDSISLQPKSLLAAVDAKLIDLQILPPDVLLNAVGEANFAFSAQGAQGAEITETTKAVDGAAEPLPLLELVDPIQAAELAAAALAAQMAIQLPAEHGLANSASNSLTLDSIGVVDSSVLLGRDALSQASKLVESTQSAVQTAANVVNAGANLPPANALLDAKPTQANTLTSGSPEVQLDAVPLVDAKLTQPDTTKANVAAQMASKTMTAETLGTLPKLSESPPTLPIEAANQTAIKVLSTEQKVAKDTATGGPTIVPTTGETNLALPQNPIEASSGSIGNITAAVIASQISNQQLTAFDHAKSDVAKLPDVRSAIPVQTDEAAQKYDSIELNAQDFEVIQTSEEVEFRSEDFLQLNSPKTEAAVIDSIDTPVQLKAGNSAQETAFKFDAKLGAQFPNELVLAGSVNSVNASKSSKPVSMGGAVVDSTKPISLAAPVVVSSQAVVPNLQVEQSQVQLTSESVVVTQQRSAAVNGQELVVETAVQTTTITKNVTTLEESSASFAPSASAAIATTSTATVHAVSALLTEHLVKQTESKAEIKAEVESISEIQSNASWETTSAKDSVKTSQIEVSSQFKVSRDARVDAKRLDADQANQVLTSNVISQQVVTETTSNSLVQTETVQSVNKGFSEVSSTFVNSLVGGPQRPITTVMDWVALKPQESPKPVLPHELRLDAGAVQVEIQRMLKQGGGHVVMELTPPDQSKFTIELKLDDKGGAYLKVEGVSDSTKTRLEQSAPQLQEQFQQMGLNLQLDMRQNRDSSSSSTSEWVASESSGSNNLQAQEPSRQDTRALAAERARKNNGGQVYLYA